jgi:hypothetical protein
MKGAPLSGLGEFIVAKWDMRQLQKNIRTLQEALPKKIARKALAEVGKFGVKKIKGQVPGRYRGVRKAIKWRQKKLRYNKGQPSIKIGAGVGKAKVPGEATTQKNNREGRAGVGFGPQNIHWWFLGTKKRFTGSKRKRAGRRKNLFGQTKTKYIRVSTGNPKRNRGRMPPQERPILVILASSKGEITSIVRRYIAQGIKQELK